MRPALLASLPRPRWRAERRPPLIAPEVRAASPALATDYEILDRELMPDFTAFDEEALRAQNTFRLGQLFVILAGAAATSLGAVQAALGGGVTELGVAEALIAGALTGAVTYIRGREAQLEYFTSRLKAEQLRGECFLFLGRIGAYGVANEEERVGRLREQVSAIASEDSA